MEWLEELPEDCPPIDAYNPNGEVYYRLTSNDNPIDSDFHSARKLHPEKKFPYPECIIRSISVFNDVDECLNMMKLPNYKKKNWKNVIKISFFDKDGLIKQTLDKANHYSWWRSKDFKLTNVEIVECGKEE